MRFSSSFLGCDATLRSSRCVFRRPTRAPVRLRQHEAVEIRRELLVSIERRQDLRYVLIRPHDDHAPRLPINAAHGKDVVAALDVGAEHLLVIVKTVASLPACISGRETPEAPRKNRKA